MAEVEARVEGRMEEEEEEGEEEGLDLSLDLAGVEAAGVVVVVEDVGAAGVVTVTVNRFLMCILVIV